MESLLKMRQTKLSINSEHNKVTHTTHFMGWKLPRRSQARAVYDGVSHFGNPTCHLIIMLLCIPKMFEESL